MILILWLVSGLGYIITRLISMAISREREYLADADGVQMCKDPLAMAEGLYKISHRYRGDMPNSFSALFIVNPSDSSFDEQEGLLPDLFSNHPPVSKRLSKLLSWAKTDIKTLEEMEAKEEKGDSPQNPAVQSPGSGTEPTFMSYQSGQWMGPYTPLQMLSSGLLTPSGWICPSGSQQVARASDIPELLPLFQQQVQGAVSQMACPRCKVPFITTQYEGAEVEQCSFCKGYLLRAGVLERLITREDVAFSPEEIKKAEVWRDSQRGPLKDREHFSDIRCPYCQNPMCKGIHSTLTQVVIDHCSNAACGAIWCDGGELETIQMLIEDAHQAAFR
jgi:Zn-finger nucleic acid-binding protein